MKYSLVSSENNENKMICLVIKNTKHLFLILLFSLLYSKKNNLIVQKEITSWGLKNACNSFIEAWMNKKTF